MPATIPSGLIPSNPQAPRPPHRHIIAAMRIWVNFWNSNGWTVRSLAEDATTVIGPGIRVAKESTLLGLLRLAGADEQTLRTVSKAIRTGGGTVAIDVNEKGRKLLQIGTL